MGFIKALFGLFLAAVILGALALGAGWVWYQNELVKPGPAAEREHLVIVPRGEGLATLAPRLEAEGVVKDARVLRLAARLNDVESAIKAGEYTIPPGASVGDVLSILVEGKAKQYRITLPEGLTTAQIARIVEADTILEGPMPDPLPAEGALLPDTYNFTRGTTREDIFEMMEEAQDDLLAELWGTRAEGVPVATPEEAIILASVVQKEAAGQTEYGKVASVFVNRLNRGIALQSDPTVHYGVNGGEPLFNKAGQRRTLYRSELERDTPWNSYTRSGLPQTAICNPGRGAIEAVLNPPETDYLFFVADGTGGHVFSTNLADHNRAVAAYRRYEKSEIARERSQ